MANSAWTKDQIVSLTKMVEGKKLTRMEMAVALNKKPKQITQKIHAMQRKLSSPKPITPVIRPTGKMVHTSGRPVNYDY